MKQFFKENWGFVATFLFFIILFSFVIHNIHQDYLRGQETRVYCGSIIEKGYDAPSSGHKSHTDAVYWVVIMDEDINQGIRVHVTPGCFYGRNKGQRVCFTLTGSEMEQYGNVNEMGHLK
jgi:hypothetical protein